MNILQQFNFDLIVLVLSSRVVSVSHLHRFYLCPVRSTKRHNNAVEGEEYCFSVSNWILCRPEQNLFLYTYTYECVSNDRKKSHSNDVRYLHFQFRRIPQMLYVFHLYWESFRLNLNLWRSLEFPEQAYSTHKLAWYIL